MKAKLFITALTFFGFSILLNAHDKTETQAQQTPVSPGRGVYIDVNNNGVCDYYENPGAYYGYGRGRGFAAAQGYGRRLVAGQGRGMDLAKGWGRGLGPG